MSLSPKLVIKKPEKINGSLLTLTGLITVRMAIANLNKSKKVLTFTTKGSNYIPKRPRICINWNPPFRHHFIKFSKTVFLSSKSCLTMFTFRGIFTKLLGMYFDTVGVEVKAFLLLFRLALAILCDLKGFTLWNNFNCVIFTLNTQTPLFLFDLKKIKFSLTIIINGVKVLLKC